MSWEMNDIHFYPRALTSSEIIEIMNEKKDWKVGDRVKLAGVEGRVQDTTLARSLGICFEGTSLTTYISFEGPLFEKLERAEPEPKTLPWIEGHTSDQPAGCYNVKYFNGYEAYYTASGLYNKLEQDAAKLREYLGLPAAVREWKEIKWPTADEFTKAAENAPPGWLYKHFQEWVCKWFREQIEGQL